MKDYKKFKWDNGVEVLETLELAWRIITPDANRGPKIKRLLK